MDGCAPACFQANPYESPGPQRLAAKENRSSGSGRDLAIDSCNAKRNYIRYPRVLFEWDEQKREMNIAKHAIDFADCEKVLAGATVAVRDDRFPYGEERCVTFGLLDGRVVAVAHLETTEIIRVISMRKATGHEQALFFEALQN